MRKSNLEHRREPLRARWTKTLTFILLATLIVGITGVTVTPAAADSASDITGYFMIQNVWPEGPVSRFVVFSVTEADVALTSAVAVPSLGAPAVCVPLPVINECTGHGLSTYPGTITINWVFAAANAAGPETRTSIAGSCTLDMPQLFNFAWCWIT